MSESTDVQLKRAHALLRAIASIAGQPVQPYPDNDQYGDMIQRLKDIISIAEAGTRE